MRQEQTEIVVQINGRCVRRSIFSVDIAEAEVRTISGARANPRADRRPDARADHLCTGRLINIVLGR